MAKEYYSLVTKVGQAKIANASVYGTKVDIKTIKLGDGNGSEYNPEEAQTDLKRVVYTGGVGAVRIDPERGNTIIIESIIPQEIGGFTIREIGYYDSAGDLIVIAKYKSQYKPVIGSGATVDMKVNTLIAVSNVDNVELKIDNTLIFATKKEVEELDKKIGVLDSLKTNNKINIVNAINEVNDKENEINKFIMSQTEKKEIILESSKWAENTYSFENEYPSDIYDLIIEPGGDLCTIEDIKLFSKAILKGNTDINKYIALGTVPQKDIHIILTITKKLKKEVV